MALGTTLGGLAATRREGARRPLVTAASLKGFAARVVPPLVVLALFLLLWEVLCQAPGSGLPPPSRVLGEAHDIIVDRSTTTAAPKGAVLAHLGEPPARRPRLRARGGRGILLGTLVGQSEWAMRGLDPIFQVLRTIRRSPGCRCRWRRSGTASHRRSS